MHTRYMDIYIGGYLEQGDGEKDHGHQKSYGVAKEVGWAPAKTLRPKSVCQQRVECKEVKKVYPSHVRVTNVTIYR